MTENTHIDLGLIIPNAAIKLLKIKNFISALEKKFPEEILAEIQLFSWVGSNTLGMLIRFNSNGLHSSYSQWFTLWAKKLRMEILELEKFGEKERKAMLIKFELTSDIKFTGSYNMEQALRTIGGRFKEIRSVRKKPRHPIKVNVNFKTADAFFKEYSENISYGGMFIRGNAKLPLRSRLEVNFTLPNRMNIKALAEIIHIVKKDKRKSLGSNHVEGFGIQFIQFLENGDKKMKHYFDKLSKQ